MPFRWLQPKPAAARRFRRAEGVSAVRHGDKTVLMSAASEGFYGLDLVGGRIWDLLETHREAGPIATALLAEFDAPADEVRRDVEEFLVQLHRDGLVEAAG